MGSEVLAAVLEDIKGLSSILVSTVPSSDKDGPNIVLLMAMMDCLVILYPA